MVVMVEAIIFAVQQLQTNDGVPYAIFPFTTLCQSW